MDRLTIGSTVTADYVYDGLERLAVRATQNMSPASTTHYVYDLAGRLIAEATSAGATVTEYIWPDDMPLAVIADVDTMSPKLWHVHADHLDRPTLMTDGTKAVVWDAWYWPFGEARSITGTATNNMRFPGQYFLVESGLAYNWHRHYDPTLGRYLQPDPLDFIDGPNIYNYAGLGPTMFVDPEGRFVPLAVAGRIAIGGILGFAADVGYQWYSTGNFECVSLATAASRGGLIGAGFGLGAGPAYGAIFSPGGIANSNRYLRIGEGRKGGDKVFRAAGDWVEGITGNQHLDFWRIGRWGKK